MIIKWRDCDVNISLFYFILQIINTGGQLNLSPTRADGYSSSCPIALSDKSSEEADIPCSALIPRLLMSFRYACNLL